MKIMLLLLAFFSCSYLQEEKPILPKKKLADFNIKGKWSLIKSEVLPTYIPSFCEDININSTIRFYNKAMIVEPDNSEKLCWYSYSVRDSLIHICEIDMLMSWEITYLDKDSMIIRSHFWQDKDSVYNIDLKFIESRERGYLLTFSKIKTKPMIEIETKDPRILCLRPSDDFLQALAALKSLYKIHSSELHQSGERKLASIRLFVDEQLVSLDLILNANGRTIDYIVVPLQKNVEINFQGQDLFEKTKSELIEIGAKSGLGLSAGEDKIEFMALNIGFSLENDRPISIYLYNPALYDYE